MTAARILVPINVAAGMLSAGTSIAEPDISSGEVAWAVGTAYTAGQRVTHEGSVWEAVAASTGVTPGADGAKWLRYGPSNRMAPFDEYTTTAARATTSLTYVLRPGFFNALRLDGLVGSSYSITLKDAPGGAVVETWAGDLWEQAIGLYELLFQPLRQLKSVSFDGIDIYPDPELTITISAASGSPVALGNAMVGDWRSLIGNAEWGGVVRGASAQRKSYTYWDEKPDGTYKIVRRPSRRDVQCQVVLDAAEAMYADALLEEVIDRLVAFEATDLPRYGYLNTAGFVSGGISDDSSAAARLDLSIKGSI